MPRSPNLRAIQSAGEGESKLGVDKNSYLSKEVWLTLLLGVTLSGL